MTEELMNEVNMALADLENNAPSAPRWQDMTAGFARLTADEPPSRWSKPIALVAAAAVAVVVVGGAVFLSSNVVSDPVTTDTTTPSTGSRECISAPEDVQSDFGSNFTVSPDPLIAGSPVEFFMRTIEDTSVEPMVGYGATWECWDGDTFVATHLLEFGVGVQGEAIEGIPGSTTTAPAIGYNIPATFTSTVPDVEPGWYRLRVDYLDRGVSHVNLLMVQVVESGESGELVHAWVSLQGDLDLESSELPLLVTYGGCVGGLVPQEVESVELVETAESVKIAVFVRLPATPYPTTCPPNPKIEYTIMLDSPLGARTVEVESGDETYLLWPIDT